MIETANYLNKRFRYKADEVGRDRWVLLEDSDEMYGDCEDYSLYIANALSGSSLLKLASNTLSRKCIFHYVTVGGDGHLVLEWDGHLIDNIVRKWTSKDDMKKYCTFIKRMSLLQVLLNLIKGKISK